MTASTTCTPEAPPATPAAPTGARTAPSPHGERGATSIELGPSRASLPPLPEILGRPPRIATEPHTDEDDAWTGVLAAMTGALQSGVAKARATDEAHLNKG
jgi:hypothetical protein